MYLFQQMQLPSATLISVLVLEQYTWILSAALEGRLTLLTALKFTPLDIVSKTTQRMQEWDVKVWKNGADLNGIFEMYNYLFFLQ